MTPILKLLRQLLSTNELDLHLVPNNLFATVFGHTLTQKLKLCFVILCKKHKLHLKDFSRYTKFDKMYSP